MIARAFEITKIDCGSCRRCCKGELIALDAKNDDATQYVTRTVINPLTGRPIVALAAKANGDCHYLGEDGCTIWGRHPAICRAFDGIDFARHVDEGLRDLRGAEKRRAKRNLVGTAYEVGAEKLRRMS